MSDDAQPGRLILDSAAGSQRLAVEGDWTLPHYAHLLEETARIGSAGNTAAPDWSRLGALDTAGASLLARVLGTERLPQLLEGSNPLDAARRALLATVGQAVADAGRAAPPRPANALLDLLGRVGGTVEACWRLGVDICGFLGLTLESLARTVFRPSTWRVTATVAQIEQTGFNAVPIVLLLTFLVGAVVAFLGATVLANFGATIFTVQLVGFSFLREFGAMLTAILIAGRTASAFTAQIGSMKANEEIDAIRAIGLDPINLLVLPRVLALLVSLPVLTFLAMLSGILGGMVVCALSLDISPTLFWSTLEDSIRVRHFFVGMAKAPMFAMVIGVIGCLEGMKVDGSAQSVGEHTTSSVVQCIFMVILIDALVALLCMEIGW